MKIMLQQHLVFLKKNENEEPEIKAYITVNEKRA